MIDTNGLEHLYDEHSDIVKHVVTERARVAVEMFKSRAGHGWERVLVHLIWGAVAGYLVWMIGGLL